MSVCMIMLVSNTTKKIQKRNFIFFSFLLGFFTLSPRKKNLETAYVGEKKAFLQKKMPPRANSLQEEEKEEGAVVAVSSGNQLYAQIMEKYGETLRVVLPIAVCFLVGFVMYFIGKRKKQEPAATHSTFHSSVSRVRAM